ncbi:histidine kinase [Alicyclobacillus hesperidum URH17-3-68]|uniref:histidine kinase n=1 Tax=Alicyclobacillus hesperidum TaxID=89784 RepID=A0A1H2U921_9BACL|nr:ATP-binding protein [Alicyclobacillus hesperidum]EJY57069.1 histidine kinase [Alicyclobacillus hesperidum URH17-3-68]SDW52089.1 His Kinase A (phospho-acceptor) domain-containing protein [Alicyclobacillus hesperidum]
MTVFRKTAWQLVALYTLAFIGILVLFAWVVDRVMAQRLWSLEAQAVTSAATQMLAHYNDQIFGDHDEIDGSPMNRPKPKSNPAGEDDPPPTSLDEEERETRDQHMVYVLQGTARQVVVQTPAGSLSNAELKQLFAFPASNRLRAVLLDNTPFLLQAVYPTSPIVYHGQPVKAVYLLYNRTMDVAFLRHMTKVMEVSIIGFAGLAAAIGIFLANRALAPISRAWTRQQQFVANASHELRTPLSIVQLHVERMFRNPSATVEEMAETLAALDRETRRLQKLVGDLLILARADSGHAWLQMREVQLDVLAREAEERFGDLARAHGVHLLTGALASVQLQADPERLRQWFAIVLDNALSFTPEGGRIVIEVLRQHNRALLVVKDTGSGIAPEHLSRVWERFYQADPSRATVGAGLGLAIAKWIVEAHSGEMSIASPADWGVGTQVTASFPVH